MNIDVDLELDIDMDIDGYIYIYIYIYSLQFLLHIHVYACVCNILRPGCNHPGHSTVGGLVTDRQRCDVQPRCWFKSYGFGINPCLQA